MPSHDHFRAPHLDAKRKGRPESGVEEAPNARESSRQKTTLQETSAFSELKKTFGFYVTQQSAVGYAGPTALTDSVAWLMRTEAQQDQRRDAMVELWIDAVDKLDVTSRMAACEAAISSARKADKVQCVAMLLPAAIEVSVMMKYRTPVSRSCEG